MTKYNRHLIEQQQQKASRQRQYNLSEEYYRKELDHQSDSLKLYREAIFVFFIISGMAIASNLSVGAKVF